MANKLLLVHDVESLGRSGDIVQVRPGYARNFLIPQGMAVIADKRALQMQARLQDERKKKADDEKKESEAIKERLEGVVLETVVKVDHDGHMYGSVNAQDIQSMIEKETKINVEKRSIQLKQPLKAVGVYTIALRLKEGVTVETLTLKIVPEEATKGV